MKGQLSDHPLAELIREISAERLTGALRLARERVRAVVYFDAGALLHARSNLRQHRLAASLRRWGVAPAKQLDEMPVDEMTDAGLGAALVAAGTFDAEELARLQARQSEDVLRHVLLWVGGTWGFDPRTRLDESVGLALDAGPLLVEGARRLPTEFAARRLADDDEIISPAPSAPEGTNLLPGEGFVLSRVADAPLRVGELVAISGVAEPEARHTVYLLALGGLLARDRWPRAFSEDSLTRLRDMRRVPATAATQAHEMPDASEASPRAPSAETPLVAEAGANVPDVRDELDSLFARAGGATYYQVLGVVRAARADDIKRAYYALAKRFHPDRFHRDADEALRARVENAFARIAQAYETLKDSKLRAGYDLKLNAAEKSGAAATPETQSGGHGSSSPPPASNSQAQATTPDSRAEESFQQGLAALRRGNRLRALMHFGDAARLAPQQAGYRAHYGQALAGDAGTRRQAEAELKTAIALEVRNVSYRVMLAELYRDIGLRARAEGELQRALAIEPRHAGARRLLESLQSTEAKI